MNELINNGDGGDDDGNNDCYYCYCYCKINVAEHGYFMYVWMYICVFSVCIYSALQRYSPPFAFIYFVRFQTVI